jgi:hypothetical protein
MWSLCNSSEVGWGAGLSEKCELEYCKVWFTHSLLHLVAFNNNSATIDSTRFCVLTVYNMCSWFFVILHIATCLQCSTLLCVMCYYIVMSCLVL